MVAVIDQARNVSPKICGAAMVLHEKLDEFDAVRVRQNAECTCLAELAEAAAAFGIRARRATCPVHGRQP